MTMSGNMSDDKQSSSDEQPCTLSARLIADDTVCDDTIGGYEPLPVMSPLVPTLKPTLIVTYQAIVKLL
jgi:hypothetical protein